VKRTTPPTLKERNVLLRFIVHISLVDYINHCTPGNGTDKGVIDLKARVFSGTNPTCIVFGTPVLIDRRQLFSSQEVD